MSSGLSKRISPPLMNLVRFKGLPILNQLHIEENLLRTNSANWCIINDGTSHPNIVMGISGKAEELIKIRPVLRDGIEVIKRFSGGGTVIVDNGTVFVTLICNNGAVPNLQPYPRNIMSWTGCFYAQVFQGFDHFHLRENDYVFGDRKFGGNAQSITKNRWVHHTSFLWDYDVRNMAYLKHPKRVPDYRLAREHMEFICRMKDYNIQRSAFIDKTIDALDSNFTVRSVDSNELGSYLDSKFSPSTRILTREELESLSFDTVLEIAIS